MEKPIKKAAPNYKLKKFKPVCGLLIVSLLAWCLYFTLAYEGQAPLTSRPCVLKLQSSAQCISLETVASDEQRVQGLSGRKSMIDTQGMLFVFDKPIKSCFWMKDMNFGLDIIWLDHDKKIVQIDRGVTPESYPKNFCPGHAAQFVIEVNDGIANQAGLSVGQTLKL